MNDFSVNEQDNKIVIIQTITKIMERAEGLKEFRKLEQEVMQLQQKKSELEIAIKNEEPKKQLEKMQENYDTICNLQFGFKQILDGDMEELKKRIRKTIKKMKLEYKWNEIRDNEKKIAIKNRILSEALLQEPLEMQDPIMMDVRNKFDTI